MGTLSRNKGASFERLIARELFDRLGITFRRNLEQSQQAGLGDLVADDPAWPWSVECKHKTRASLPEWQRQAAHSAHKAALLPCVIYRITGQPIRVSVPLSAIHGPANEWVDMTLDGFAWLSREMMADRTGSFVSAPESEGADA